MFFFEIELIFQFGQSSVRRGETSFILILQREVIGVLETIGNIKVIKILFVYPVFFFLFRNFRKVRKTNYKIVGIECRNVVGGKVDKFSLRENILDVNPSRLLKFIVFILYI